MSIFLSYYDCLEAGCCVDYDTSAFYLDYSSVDSPIWDAPQEVLVSDLAYAAEVETETDSDHHGWSHQNSDVGVGLTMNPEATDWQDMVHIHWD